MKLRSELDTLIGEYKKVYGLANVPHNDVSHSEEFQQWLSEIVMDTLNYEKLLTQVIANHYEINSSLLVSWGAEVDSKPLLSCSKNITVGGQRTINYSHFVKCNGISDLKTNLITNISKQRCIKDLSKDIGNINLLLMKSNESENMNLQRGKLTRVNTLSINHNIPFIVGCYGHQESKLFRQKEQLLSEFLNTLVDSDCQIYTESYNGVACRIIASNKSKELVKTKRYY